MQVGWWNPVSTIVSGEVTKNKRKEVGCFLELTKTLYLDRTKLTKDQRAKVWELLAKYKDVFEKSPYGRTSDVKRKINAENT